MDIQASPLLEKLHPDITEEPPSTLIPNASKLVSWMTVIFEMCADSAVITNTVLICDLTIISSEFPCPTILMFLSMYMLSEDSYTPGSISIDWPDFALSTALPID